MSGSLQAIEGFVQKKMNVYVSFSKHNLYLIPAHEEQQESLIIPLNEIAVDCSDTNIQVTFFDSDDSCYTFSFNKDTIDRKLWNRLKQ